MKPGTRRTRCKKITPSKKANQLNLFENTPILKIDSFDLAVKPWNNRAKHSVANAIVLATMVSPVDNPKWKAISEAIAINIPSITTVTAKFLFNKGVLIFLGLSFIIFLLWGSRPIAIAGKLSVSKLMNSRWAGAKGIVDSSNEAYKTGKLCVIFPDVGYL